MELTWWPVAIAGFALLAVVVGLAVLLPMAHAPRRLRPLANVDRLTRLPEYARAARVRRASALATVLMLAVLFGAAVIAGARPVDVRAAEASQPEEVMLCVGQPATDPATAAFLSYFAEQVTTGPGTERIGLTSSNRRVVPLTRDYQYAAGRFNDYAGLEPASDEAGSFAPAVTYVDYARTVEDVLALCLTGFPTDGPATAYRRSLIYLGPSVFRADGAEPGLFTADQVGDLASDARAQVNIVAVADPTESSRDADAALEDLVERTGGQFFRQLPAGVGGGADQLTTRLDAIRADPPPAVPADSGLFSKLPGESPTVPLTIALLSAAVLSVALVVLRR